MGLWGAITLVLVTVAACGDGGVVEGNMAPPDADPPDGSSGGCWPGDGTFPKGALTLGTRTDALGTDTFVPMPDALQLQYAVSGAYGVIADVRMSGLAPGNPGNILDPGNPRTRIRAFFADDNVALDRYTYCPFRAAYLPVSDAYQAADAFPIWFEACWHSDQLFNRVIRIEATIMDASGGYATDVKTVALLPPTGFNPPDVGLPGCP